MEKVKKTKFLRTKNGRIMLLSKCSFIKEQEAKGLLGNLLGAKIPILGVIPLVNTLF